MSKYEWERGTLVIPEGARDGLQRGLVAEANRRQLGLQQQARDLYQRLTAAGKGQVADPAREGLAPAKRSARRLE